jgi:hypothetical protein
VEYKLVTGGIIEAVMGAERRVNSDKASDKVGTHYLMNTSLISNLIF